MLRYIYLLIIFFSIQINSDIFVSSPKIKLNTDQQRLIELKIENTKIVAVGAGASGIACLEMLVKLGAKRENIWLSDSKGLITKNRKENINII